MERVLFLMYDDVFFFRAKPAVFQRSIPEIVPFFGRILALLDLMHRQGTKECKNNLTPGSLLREIRPKKDKN